MPKLFMSCIIVLVNINSDLKSCRRLMKYHSLYLLCVYLRLCVAICPTGMYFQCATGMRYSLCVLVRLFALLLRIFRKPLLTFSLIVHS